MFNVSYRRIVTLPRSPHDHGPASVQALLGAVRIERQLLAAYRLTVPKRALLWVRLARCVLAAAVSQAARTYEALATRALPHARHADPCRRVDRVAEFTEDPRWLKRDADVSSPESPHQEAFTRHRESTLTRS